MDTSVGASVILDEELDENYEPTADEVKEYAAFLGMDVDRDTDLFWVAREGLKTALPPGWKPCKTESDELYYFNFDTGDSTWDHPCDSHFKNKYQEEKKKRDEKRRLGGGAGKKKAKPGPSLLSMAAKPVGSGKPPSGLVKKTPKLAPLLPIQQ
ncbi:hypothetical protein KIPB_014558, partial [Kipferlia bialata]|eukprot:g14558.t1